MALLSSARNTDAAPARAVSEIERLKQRDREAWTAVFQREHPLVFRFALAQVGNHAVAEDIAGQVFLEAIEGIRRYHDRGRPLSAWLITIARHRSSDWFRRRGRERVTGVEQADQVQAGPQQSGGVALSVLAALTPEQREVVHLRFAEGYSLEEVATLTGRRVGAVKALQHRALARLRVIVEQA